ncbi:F-box domain protein [Geosmithia morbida]|uniref:F-box domain protein n=1 Tax=Geosmithia morbida TaxID=1094350 RepID=A0A9P4YP21_9HYPO|nr:F-box domain protein [Geosmithia morbida]KAF4120503.1 F-box domain protein [Geosmithia morbida]
MRLPFRLQNLKDRRDAKKKSSASSSVDLKSSSSSSSSPHVYGYGYADADGSDAAAADSLRRSAGPPPTYLSAQLVGQLPPKVLQRIFAFVCPHACDETYETCEESASDRSCMLCDLRDLAHCVRVSRQWRRNAIPVLYHSIRIDPVHYCSLEAVLSEKRKKTSRFDRNGVPEDPAQARLRLLRRTVRDDPTRLGSMVEFLKIPYMLRESSHVELAQTIAVLPNLHYVDLPEGMFSDEPNLATLRLEVQARCPSMRKMTYEGGAEQSLRALATGTVWPRLEVLELNGVSLDPPSMRRVLAGLGHLRALKVSDTYGLSDEVLVADDGQPSLPPLQELVLRATPRVTAAGITSYLSWVETQQALRVLTLVDTGVHPASLADVLAVAPALRTLALQATVTEPFPQAAGAIPASSRKLETLRFEISPAPELGPYAAVDSSYYGYLAGSIVGGGMPNLRRLYVLDETMPDQLQGLSPPNAAFSGGGGGGGGGGGPRTSHSRPASFTASGRQPPTLRLSPDGTPSSLAPPGHRQHAHPHPPQPPVLARPQSPGLHAEATKRFSSKNPFAAHGASSAPTHALEVFIKAEEAGQWNFTSISSARSREVVEVASSRPSSSAGNVRPPRPVSSFGLGADIAGQGWENGEARRSVMVGSGSGPFLAVAHDDAVDGPDAGDDARSFRGGGMLSPRYGSPPGGNRASSESWRPKSSGGASTRDLWR